MHGVGAEFAQHHLRPCRWTEQTERPLSLNVLSPCTGRVWAAGEALPQGLAGHPRSCCPPAPRVHEGI